MTDGSLGPWQIWVISSRQRRLSIEKTFAGQQGQMKSPCKIEALSFEAFKFPQQYKVLDPTEIKTIGGHDLYEEYFATRMALKMLKKSIIKTFAPISLKPCGANTDHSKSSVYH